MSDSKKYYYLKLKEDFYDREEIKVIESLPNGYKYSNILLKMYLKALKREGKLMITDCIPYSLNTLAAVLGHDEDTVKRAVEIFKEFKLVEILDDGKIYMLEIQNFIGKSSTEADRKRIYRQEIELEANQALPALKDGGQDKCPPNVRQPSDISPPEIEIEIELENRDKDIKNNNVASDDAQPVDKISENTIAAAEKTAEADGAQEPEKAFGKGEEYSVKFLEFWEHYPRKKEKRKAWRMWKVRIKEKVKPEDLIRASQNYNAACKDKSPQFVKLAATFLGPDKPYEDYLGVVGLFSVPGSKPGEPCPKCGGQGWYVDKNDRGYDDVITCECKKKQYAFG